MYVTHGTVPGCAPVQSNARNVSHLVCYGDMLVIPEMV